MLEDNLKPIEPESNKSDVDKLAEIKRELDELTVIGPVCNYPREIEPDGDETEGKPKIDKPDVSELQVAQPKTSQWQPESGEDLPPLSHEAQHLANAIKLTTIVLDGVTGHDAYQAKKIAVYAAATHYISAFDPFPALAIYGSMSTGKTNTLDVLKHICYKVTSLTGQTTTDAAFRASMGEAHMGTLITEEAEGMTSKGDLEDTIITRYSLSSAKNMKMVSVGKGWRKDVQATFGATIFHRRNLFRDPALLRRVIPVKTKRVKKEYVPLKTFENIFPAIYNGFKTKITLPDVTNRWDIEAGIFDAYRPLVAITTAIGDSEFLESLVAEMRKASSKLRTEETDLEPAILLKILVLLTYAKVKDNVTDERINIEVREISPAIRDEYGADCPVLKLSANQRNNIIRDDLGFEIRSSHGRQRVYLTIPALIKRCDEYEIQDEQIETWRKKLLG